MLEDIRGTLTKKFRSKNIKVEFFNSLDDAKRKVLEIIHVDKSIGIGNSVTLKKMNISETLNERGNIVYDKTLARTKDESTKLKKMSLLTDWYITSSNAISMEGHIVNIDHSGNRVAAMIYGPDNVIIVVGKNKVADTLEAAIYRAKNLAAPLNAKRAGHNPPCVNTNKCVDCNSDEKVCNSIVIIQGQENKDRMRLFIVDEEVGF